MKLLSHLLEYAVSLGFRRALASHPNRSKYQNRHSARRINTLLPSSGSGKRYLEIGVARGVTFEAVRAEFRVCVDPAPLFRRDSLPAGSQLIVSTSDDFFADGANGEIFDFIFLDGLHTAEATYRDLVGALNCLSPGGTILIDDVMPTDEASSLPSYSDSQTEKKLQAIGHSRWYGDVWRLVWLLVSKHPAIELSLIGSGGEDHTQAIVKCPKGPSGFGLNPEADLAFMGNLSFDDVVKDGALSALASPEELILSRFTP